MSTLQLPKFTFLNGPAGSGKSTLASLLLAQDPDLCLLSFADPIRMALTATFYPDYLYTPNSLNLKDASTKASDIPGVSCSHRNWMIEFGKFMHATCGKTIFGELAWRMAYESNVHYPRFLVDGLRTDGDIAPFLREEKARDLCIIQLYRKGKDWTGDLGSYVDPIGIPFVCVHNDTTPDFMLNRLKAVLGVTDARDSASLPA